MKEKSRDERNLEMINKDFKKVNIDYVGPSVMGKDVIIVDDIIDTVSIDEFPS
jgi:phosphoribosylpyrophosphate synthetase